MGTIILLGALSMLVAGIVLTTCGARERRLIRPSITDQGGTRDVAIGITTIVLGSVVLLFSGLFYLVESMGPIWGP